MNIKKLLEGLFCGDCIQSNKDKDVQISVLKEEIKSYENTVIDAKQLDLGEIWDGQWKKAHITYPLTNARTRLDVRTIFACNINEEIALRKVARKWEKLGDDEIALKALKYVMNRVTYTSDERTKNVPEYWQYPYDTYENKVGDCEDGAILILKLLALAGVPAWRRKLCAGYVQPSTAAPQGGHAYAIYLADDFRWYVLDWCYFPSKSLRYFKVKQHKDIPYYKDIWWTTNEVWSWNQSDFRIGKSIKP